MTRRAFASRVETYHNELIRTIGFTPVMNCINSFIQESHSYSDYFHIVELCFVYLLRIFVQDTVHRIEENQKEVTELLRFLYEALFQPCFIHSVPLESESAAEPLPIALQVHTDEMVLMDYVMSLFSLLCYNCKRDGHHSVLAKHSPFIQPSLVAQICERLDAVTNINVTLFLHQLLVFCLATDRRCVSARSRVAALVDTFMEAGNLQALIANLHRYPSESLLVVFAKMIRMTCVGASSEEVSASEGGVDASAESVGVATEGNTPFTPTERTEALLNTLSDLAFPSILVSLITLSNSDDDARLSPEVSQYTSSAGVSSTESRAVLRTVRLYALDLLHCFFLRRSLAHPSFLDGHHIVLDDPTLIGGLLATIRLFLNTRNPQEEKIVVLSATLLLRIGSYRGLSLRRVSSRRELLSDGGRAVVRWHDLRLLNQIQKEGPFHSPLLLAARSVRAECVSLAMITRRRQSPEAHRRSAVPRSAAIHLPQSHGERVLSEDENGPGFEAGRGHGRCAESVARLLASHQHHREPYGCGSGVRRRHQRPGDDYAACDGRAVPVHQSHAVDGGVRGGGEQRDRDVRRAVEPW